MAADPSYPYRALETARAELARVMRPQTVAYGSVLPPTVRPPPSAPAPDTARIGEMLICVRAFQRQYRASRILWEQWDASLPDPDGEERGLFARMTLMREALDEAQARFIDLVAREVLGGG